MKTKGLLKKMIAVTLGITMASGALMLPNAVVKNEFVSASANEIEVNGCKFTFDIENDHGREFIRLKNVENHGETVEIPAYINDIPVEKIQYWFLRADKTVKTVIFPDTVKQIGEDVLSWSTVETIVLPNGLESLDKRFASNCENLNTVEYHGTGIKSDAIGKELFTNSNVSNLINEKGALCLGNWLIRYDLNDSDETLKIADLADEGQTITGIAPYAFNCPKDSTSGILDALDLTGVYYIGESAFENNENLFTIINHEKVVYVGNNAFKDTSWYEKKLEKNIIKLGKALIYYRTDAEDIDLNIADIKYVSQDALKDCTNAVTIRCSSNCLFHRDSLYVANKKSGKADILYDNFPINSKYKIKNVYLDGEKLTADLLVNDTKAFNWLMTNLDAFDKSELTKAMMEEKTKRIFEQMDITYYGMDNDKAGTLSPTEEFYIRLKIHDYLSIYDYDHYSTYGGFVGAMLLGGKVHCQGYAEMAHYLLECAGVKALTYESPLYSDENGAGFHYWNAVRIGDEWFESDDGWDEQGGHGSGWFLQSSARITAKDSRYHKYLRGYSSYHVTNKDSEYLTDQIIGERTLGDIDGDDIRDEKDPPLLWDYIKGKTKDIDKKAADINFDGKVDVTDAVILDRLVFGTALDVNNIPTDGLAPGYWVAFIKGTDYDNIQYLRTDREGYITLPEDLFEIPEGMKIRYNIGKPGEKIRITKPYTVVTATWVDKNAPDYILGDVNDDGSIDIEDAVAIIQHINGMTPLTADEELRADVTKDKNIDINDAVTLISYINGNSTF